MSSPASLASLLGLAPVPGDRQELFTSVLPTIISSIGSVAAVLANAHHVALAGGTNTFGDDQLNVDVAAEKAIRSALSKCPSIVTVSSEEDPIERPQPAASSTATPQTGEQYTIAFDPLDGSSIIAPNWTVGAIFGIWDGPTAVGADPTTKQIAAVLGVFGPRTTALVAVRVPGMAPLCFEIGLTGVAASLLPSPAPPCIELLRPAITLLEPPFKTRYFSPANLRCAAQLPTYAALINHYITSNYTLRYIGGLVPDVIHILVKGHGVYVNPVIPGAKAKLRALYELFPVALILECAGGKAVNPMDGRRMLETPAATCGDKGAFLFGTGEEVDFAVGHLKE
ncbi:hypothetical protein BROUX41_003643 [Berkeleyomyces rouxiae]|uniref:uncharacterized protein n=1 Tax=Berkeleyomyces rouxiae TaxID=2035830 RepID=UPI003B7ED9B6